MTNYRADFEAIGTRWTIEASSSIGPAEWSRLLRVIRRRISRFDKNYSRFRSDSLISQLAQKAGRYRLPPDAYELLDFYERLYRRTAGKLTPLIGQALSDAGYDADYSFKAKALSQAPPWDRIIKYGHDYIELAEPAVLDFGAAGKGYLIDIIGQLLKSAGVGDFIINGGGDILRGASNHQTVDIGLQDPLDDSRVIGVLSLAGESLCASAGNKRKWGKFNHILDPETLESPNEILATWVVASRAMLADGLATALFFVEPEALVDFDFGYAILRKDRSLKHSANLPIKVFTVEEA